MRRLLGALLGAVLLAPPAATAMPMDRPPPPAPDAAPVLSAAPVHYPAVAWRSSRAIGTHTHGRLGSGVQVPDEGRDFFTWDPINRMSPNREWRRWGTDRLVRTLLRVVGAHRRAHPDAPRVGIGDLSRPHGGDFGTQYGGLGHVSHQNGLDADVYYPRRDGRKLRAGSPRLVDRALSQDLVDRFVAAGARYVFTGPSLSLHGPPRIVQKLVHHDDHMHVRLP
jgi:murein endopeptidase